MVKFDNDWDEILKGEFHKPYYKELHEFLKKEYSTHTIYPDMYDIFNALKYTPYNKVKVLILGQDPYHEPGQAHGLAFSVQKGVKIPPSLVNIYKELHDDIGFEIPLILGQDPYHEPGQAHGLAFSVQKGVKIPPSLVNIYKELHDDIGFEIPNHGYLKEWADRGVLLLNAVLTVRRGQANSHKGKGWEIFTDEVIKKLNERKEPIVFILWGANARSKKKFITNPNHHILESVHPSPLSAYRGFFGGKYFSKVNQLLDEPIDWTISK